MSSPRFVIRASRSTILLVPMLALAACEKSEPRAATRNVPAPMSPFFVDPKFPGGDSVIIAARRVFPESQEIALMDFWISEDATHEFVVFFAGREIKGSFESMYWRYLAFVKKKTERDWSNARVFDLPDNHPRALSKSSLAWLEQNAVEQREPVSGRSSAP